MTDVGFVTAFAAGIVALLSPCSALLLPSFFAYSFGNPGRQLLRTALFYAGLVVTLVPLGVGASAVSVVFYGHRPLLIAVAGWTIIGLGVVQVIGRSFAMPFAARLQRLAGRSPQGKGWLSTVVLGATYGLAGFCSGPVLGAILTMAATRQSPVQGGVLLAVYALGMAVPLFVLAALWDRFDLGRRRWLRGRAWTWGPVSVHSTSLVSGVFFIGIGVLFLVYDGTAGITGTLGLGDTTELEFTAQQHLGDWLSAVPPWVAPAAVAAAALVIAVRRAVTGVRSDRGSRRAGQRTTRRHGPPTRASRRRSAAGHRRSPTRAREPVARTRSR